MDPSPLVIDEIEAGAELIEQLNVFRPVKAACWLRESEDTERYLYVALQGLTVANTSAAYREVLCITQAMKDHYLDPFRVNLISTSDPVATAVIDIYRRFPDRRLPGVNGHAFAGRSVVSVYIYPELPSKP